MTYRLVSLTGQRRNQTLGEYDTYREAVTARGADAYQQLVDNEGWWLRVEHVIVGPGLAGPATDHRFCSEFGVDPHRHEPPSPGDLLDAREWLEDAHRG